MFNLDRDRRGFTLIELLVVIVILSVLSVLVVPAYIGYVDKGKAAADQHTLGVLNEATRVYYTGEPNPNPFEQSGQTDDALLQVLVDAGILPEKPKAKLQGNVFVWYASDKSWRLAHELSATEIIMGTGGFTGSITGSYTGTATELTIPKAIGGVTVTNVYQDAFRSKSLTALIFPVDSAVTRIHARAFMNNGLTEVVFPSSLTRLDYGAFMDNDITKVTIGAGVTLEGNVFRSSDAFRDAYYALGAGTYVYSGGKWTKQ